MLCIHNLSQLALLLRRIVELKEVLLRIPRVGEGAELLPVGEKIVHALLRDGILIYFKKF